MWPYDLHFAYFLLAGHESPLSPAMVEPAPSASYLSSSGMLFGESSSCCFEDGVSFLALCIRYSAAKACGTGVCV